MNPKNELSRITIDISKADHKKLKAMAALEGKSMREIIIESIEERIHAERTSDEPSDARLKQVVEDVLKKYAPALEKLAKS